MAVSYSHDSGVYAQDQLGVTLSAPEGCTIAFTTDGRIPTAREDCGLQEVDIVLEDDGTGYLIRNRDRMVYPDLFRSFLWMIRPCLRAECFGHAPSRRRGR